MKSKTRKSNAYNTEENDKRNRKAIMNYGYTIIDDIKVRSIDTKVDCIDANGYYVSVTLYRLSLGNKPRIFWSNKRKVENLKILMKRESCTLLSNNFYNGKDKVTYIARCGHENEQSIYKFLDGFGRLCKKCSHYRGTYNLTNAERYKDEWKNVDANVYIIRMYNELEDFYKIGITTQEVHRRCTDMGGQYETLICHIYKTNLYDAIQMEENLHLLNKTYSYTPTYKFGGWTECFSELKTETFMKGVD